MGPEITGNTFFYEWEPRLISLLQNNAGGPGAKLAEIFTCFGEPFIFFLVIGLFYWGLDKKYGKYIAANLFSVCLFGSLIKNILMRRRPYLDHESISCIRPAESGDINDIALQGYSFPSLHSATSVTLFTLLGRHLKSVPWKMIMCLIPFLVGVSRIILGVHYPTDVLAGWALGLLVMFLIDLLIKKLPDIHYIFVILLVIGCPGFFFCDSSDFYTIYGLILGSVFAFIFERRYVNFRNTENILRALLRVAGGIGIFLVLSVLLKLPFPKELLEAKTSAAFLIRTGRYAVSAFVILGVYPLCFSKRE